MANTTFSEHDTDAPTVEVEWGGRRFSPLLDARPKLPQNRIRKLQAGPEEFQLPVRIGEAIRSQLVWSQVSANETERQPIVKAYVDSLNQMAQFRQDVEDMTRYACLANLEFRQAAGETDVQARDAVLDAKLDQMLAEAACDWRPLANILDASLIPQPVPTLRSRLDAALVEAVDEFTQQFCELLAKLVDRTLFGLVEWLPNQCCNYFFFRSVVIQENEGASQPITESRFEEPNPGPRDRRRIIGKRTITEVLGKGKHNHRLARHEHLVIDAVRTSIRDSRVVMPPEVERLVEHIPAWLYPFVKVIDGTICRERIIERDTRVEDWVNVQVHDEPIYGWEPAVIIGPYVLTGWGPREIEQEQARRHTIQPAASWAQAEVTAWQPAPWVTAVLVAVTLVALMPFFQWFQEHNPRAFFLVVGFAVLALLWPTRFDVPTAPGIPASPLAVHYCAANLACRIFLFYLLISFWLLPLYWPAPTWPAPGVIAFIAVLGYVIGGRFQEARLRECLNDQRIL